MDKTTTPRTAGEIADVLKATLDIGVNLSQEPDRSKLFNSILTQTRRQTRCEGGSLYILEDKRLRLLAAQNDKIPAEIICRVLDRDMTASKHSLAGYVTHSGRVMNVPDAYSLASGSPFHLARDLDAAMNYRTVSVLAIPLKCPDGQTIGVLELINRLSPDGKPIPFSDTEIHSVMPLASMAAVTIHNDLLRRNLKRAHLDTIIRLSTAAEFRDDASAGHIRSVSNTSAILAGAIGLDDKKIELVQYAAPMHDIGKVGIPDNILKKPDELTPKERSIVETHTTIGAKILDDPKNDLMVMAREVAMSHHEKWDGRGYPQKLAGHQIPLAARIVALADVFDTLISKRCYKDAYSLDTALDIIRSEASKHFDPRLVDAFFENLYEILQACDRPLKKGEETDHSEGNSIASENRI